MQLKDLSTGSSFCLDLQAAKDVTLAVPMTVYFVIGCNDCGSLICATKRSSHTVVLPPWFDVISLGN